MGYSITFRRFRGRLKIWSDGEAAGFVSIRKGKTGGRSTYRAFGVNRTESDGEFSCEKIGEYDNLRSAVYTVLSTVPGYVPPYQQGCDSFHEGSADCPDCAADAVRPTPAESLVHSVALEPTGRPNENAVMVRPGVAVGRLVERKTGFAAYNVRGFVGFYFSRVAAVAALTIKIAS